MASFFAVKFINPPAPHFERMSDEVKAELPQLAFKAATLAGGFIVKTMRRGKGSGRLSASFQPARFIKEKGDVVSAGALSDLVYADIQNRGGTIKPRTVKLLAVPLTREAKERWPRDWPRDSLAYVQLAKSRKPVLIDAKQKFGEKMIVHYVLKRANKIKGKRYLERAEKVARPQIAKLTGQTMTVAIRTGAQSG